VYFAPRLNLAFPTRRTSNDGQHARRSPESQIHIWIFGEKLERRLFLPSQGRMNKYIVNQMDRRVKVK